MKRRIKHSKTIDRRTGSEGFGGQRKINTHVLKHTTPSQKRSISQSLFTGAFAANTNPVPTQMHTNLRK